MVLDVYLALADHLTGLVVVVQAPKLNLLGMQLRSVTVCYATCPIDCEPINDHVLDILDLQ